uniref:Uncharacterized protein n=1 Tax=Cacopsylla melanoneura TaxID=428564 RepID=A0A8D8RS30_9HEMI
MYVIISDIISHVISFSWSFPSFYFLFFFLPHNNTVISVIYGAVQLMYNALHKTFGTVILFFFFFFSFSPLYTLSPSYLPLPVSLSPIFPSPCLSLSYILPSSSSCFLLLFVQNV